MNLQDLKEWTQGEAKKKHESKYMPHNGEKEKAKRRKEGKS